jgi:hypothetical protein
MKTFGVYHMKNLLIIEEIAVSNPISDYPILITASTNLTNRVEHIEKTIVVDKLKAE